MFCRLLDGTVKVHIAGEAVTMAAEYRRYPVECLGALRLTRAPEVKAALLLMAERWNKLAEYVERAASVVPSTDQ